MKLRLEKYLRYSLISLLLVVFAGIATAQTGTELEEAIKPIKYWEFDKNLIPAKSIYGDSWDSLHVDSPFFDKKRIAFGFYLDLVEDGCEYNHPFQGVVTSNFGWRRGRMHKGIDIDLEIGDPVYAAFDGVVRIAKYNAGGFGNYVMIRHYNGLETIYAHFSESIVVRNQTVRAGQIIGYGGSTGRSTGSHLHFETRFMGQAFNPTKIIDFRNFSLKTNQVFLNHTWFPYISKTGTSVRPVTKRVYHRIRSGDTLYGLSRRYGVSVNQICRLNGIRRTTILRIGRTLRIR